MAFAPLRFFAQNYAIDLNYIPFSYYGSYLSIVPQEYQGKKDLFILDVSGRRMWTFKGIFKVEATFQGDVIKCDYTASTSKITLKTEKGMIEIVYDDCNTLRFRGQGVGLRLTQCVYDGSSNSSLIKPDSSQWRILMGGYPHVIFTQIKGKSKVVSPLTIPGEKIDESKPQNLISISPAKDGFFECAFEQYNSAWRYHEYENSFDYCAKVSERNFQSFLKGLYPVGKAYNDLLIQAAYLKWSTVVMPRGFLSLPAMLCSKSTMSSVWSWDNCFSAMSVSYMHSKLALDQFRLVFNNQSAEGSLPDLINDNHWMWGAVKPPIQALALKYLMEMSADSVKYSDFADLYEPICRFTNFWFDYQDDDHDGIPQYNITNDSGEDNGTVFEAGFPLESPDLCAYLVIQMEFLSEMANDLGRASESKIWMQRSVDLLQKLINELWNGEKFIAKHSISGKCAENSRSFLNYIPIILGKRLPEKILKKLIFDLKDPNGIVTPFGPASEHPKSIYYKEDGYWRGPVWAPNTFLLVYGLDACGESDFAKEIAKRYINLCQKSGFPENFSSLNGRPLRDMGYSWTADVFILLAYKYFRE